MSWRWGLAAPQEYSGFQEPSLTYVRFMHSRGNSENSPWSLCNLLYILSCAVLGPGCYSLYVTLRGGKNILQLNDRVLEITLAPYWRRVSGAGHFFLISQWNNVFFFKSTTYKTTQASSLCWHILLQKDSKNLFMNIIKTSVSSTAVKQVRETGSGTECFQTVVRVGWMTNVLCGTARCHFLAPRCPAIQHLGPVSILQRRRWNEMPPH